MNKLMSRVLDMINLKGCEWLNKKTLLSREEFRAGIENCELTQKCFLIHMSSHIYIEILNYFFKLKFGFWTTVNK